MGRTKDGAVALSSVPVDGELVPAGGYSVVSREPRAFGWFRTEAIELLAVRGLSAHAVWLEALPQAGPRSMPRGKLRGQLWLECDERRVGPLSVELTSAAPPDWLDTRDSAVTSVALLRGPLEELRALAAYTKALADLGIVRIPETAPSAGERIVDRQEIIELLQLLAREGVEGSVRTSSGRAQVRLLEVDAETACLRWDVGTSDWVVPSNVEIPYIHAAYQIPIVELNRELGTAKLPDWIVRSVRRGFRRAPAPRGLSIAFAHPLTPELRIELPLRDLSRSGLSFEADAVAQLLYPGLELPSFELRRGDDLRGVYRGCVRSCRSQVSSTDAIVGLSFEPATHAATDVLRQLLEPALYPSTHGHAVDVWDVHESSGYLSLSGKQPGDFERLRVSFTHAAKKLERAPEIASVAYWPAQGAVEATISHFKAYQSSWLVCQLSKRKGGSVATNSRQGIRDMYLRIYESAQADPDTRWLLGYVQDAAPGWSREVHVGIPQRYSAIGEGCLVPFRALETDVTRSAVRALRTEARVIAADAVTAKAAMRDLHRVRPAQYLDALDLTESRWDLAAIRGRWNIAGLERQRQLFVAYEGTQRCALAVVEVAEPGVHLYGLMDCLRMYPLRPGGELAFGALLREAHDWFAQRGRTRFAYLEEFPQALSPFDLGFRDLGRATLTMLSIDRLPELMQRVADLASRRPPPPKAAHHPELRP